MGKSDFGVPEIDATCDVCGATFNRKFGNDISGKFVCVFCTRYRHMVHAIRYVEHMAAKDCQQTTHFPEGSTEEWFSRLDCGCDSCNARKVARFMTRWQTELGNRPVRRP